MSLLSKCKLSPMLCLFFSLILLTDAVHGTRSLDILLVIYLSVFAHEVAHGLVGEFFGYKVKQLKLTCYGGYCEFESGGWVSNNRHKFHIAAAGPAINLLISYICLLIDQPFWAELNLTFALFNLIPTLPMDGAYILEAVINKYTDNKFAPLFIGVFAGFCAALYFSNSNLLATLFLMFFTGLNVAKIYDLAMADSPREYKKPKAKIFFFQKERLFVPIGPDRDLIDVTEEANIRLKTMIDIYPSQLIENILNEENMDYDLELRVV